MQICQNYSVSSMKFLLSLLLFFSTGFFSYSQNNSIKGIIAGNVIDTTTGKAIAAATIKLTPYSDTAASQSYLSDENGAFEIPDISFGYYNIQFSAVGFSKIKLDSIHFRADRYDFNLGDIKMFPEATELETVIVYAEKPLVEYKEGAVIYNVGESVLSATSSTVELLKTMPLISNDADGKILLKGREPRILIDGKPTNLNGDQLNDLLEAMPGGMIDKIELQTTPPAEYASESGGVINIVTKKGKVGITARLNTYVGSRGDANLSGTIGYRNKKWVLQGTVGTRYSRLKSESESLRETFFFNKKDKEIIDSSNFLLTRTQSRNQALRPNLRFSADYEINKQSQWNITAMLNYNEFKNISANSYQNLDRFKNVTKFSTRNNTSDGASFTPSITSDYRWRNKKNPKQMLSLFGSMNFGTYNNDRIFIQQFLNPDGTTTGRDSTVKQFNDNKNFGWELRGTYNLPLSKQVLLNTGATAGFDPSYNELITQIFEKASGTFERIDSMSPKFKYFQNVYTLRSGLTIDLPKTWRIITGAQLENTGVHFRFTNGTNNSGNNYWIVMPNLTIRKEWRPYGFSSALTYRRAIRRPTLNQLNPSVDYSNLYSIRFGNPTLTPQLSDNFDWNLGYFKTKFNINLSLGYNDVKDIIQLVRTLIPGDKTQITFQNISARKEYEATLIGGYTFSKKIRMNFGGGYSYNEYSDYDKKNNKYKDGATYYGSLNGNYIITDKITFETNLRYNSLADPQGRSRSTLKQIFGLQTRWLKKRLMVGFTAIDPFKQQDYTTQTFGKNFNITTNYLSYTRNFRISVAYNLTKPPVSQATKQKAITNAVKKAGVKKKK